MNAEEVAIYLKTHPEFFVAHGEVLADVRIPHPHGDAALSLGERQLGVMRDKCRALEGKLAELIRFGEENDAIGEKVHRLGVALLGTTDLSAAVAILRTHLGGAFAVPHVAVRLWGVGGAQVPPSSAQGGSGAIAAEEFLPVPDTLKAYAGGLINPYCGFAAGQEAVAWFGEAGAHIRSLAQVPLREHGQDGGVCFGLLVLASEEVQRFYPDMGVLYLQRIGDMASAALLRVVG